MAEQRGTRREIVSPYLLRPRRSIEEVMVQRRRPAAAAVDLRPTTESTSPAVAAFAKPTSAAQD